MARKQSKRIPLGGVAGRGDGSQAEGLTHNPFAALRAKVSEEAGAGEAPSSPIEKQGRAQVAAGPSADLSAGSPSGLPSGAGLAPGAAVVVRHERKGHGGKTVTVIDLSRAGSTSKPALEALARDLRKALGAGARAGDQEVTVQGDLVERVARFLEETHGARVTLGTR